MLEEDDEESQFKVSGLQHTGKAGKDHLIPLEDEPLSKFHN